MVFGVQPVIEPSAGRRRETKRGERWLYTVFASEKIANFKKRIFEVFSASQAGLFRF
jgi:hypothetical protein